MRIWQRFQIYSDGMCNLLLSDTEMYFPDAGGGYILSVKAMRTKDGEHNKKKKFWYPVLILWQALWLGWKNAKIATWR